MSELLKRIDARTKLAGSNKLEMLLFSLGKDQRTGREETFGINVFKVREVMRIPEITHAPDMPASVEGMVSLRGSLVPVETPELDLTRQFYFIWHKQKYQTAAMREFLDLCRQLTAGIRRSDEIILPWIA